MLLTLNDASSAPLVAEPISSLWIKSLFKCFSTPGRRRERTREEFQKQKGTQMPSFCSCYCSGLGPVNSVSIPCFSLSWFVWWNLMINTNLWGQSHLTQKATAGKLSFLWSRNFGSHWSAVNNRRQRYGPDNFFSLPMYESRTFPSWKPNAQAKLC